MNKETYEALKRLIEYCRCFHADNVNKDCNKVEAWAGEVAKEYEEE